MCSRRSTPAENKAAGEHKSVLCACVCVWCRCLDDAHSQALREVEFLFACGAVCGAEETRLVEAQLLQFLRVLRQSGREEQLLQRHLRRRQTETHKRTRRLLMLIFYQIITRKLNWINEVIPRHCDWPWLHSLKDRHPWATPTFIDCLGHLIEPSLLHAVNHSVCFIYDLEKDK